jgi:diguanylate cyclase (GGDEF)-like protein
MRLSTITNLAYTVTLVLTALSAAAFILSARSAALERLAVERHLELDELAEQLALLAEERTDEARLYVMRGDERHLASFYVDEDQERRLEKAVDHLSGSTETPAERDIFRAIRTDVDALGKIENEAVKAYRAGLQAEARQMLFGDVHYRLHTRLISNVGEVRESLSQRSRAAVDAAKADSDFFGMIARTMLALTAAMFLAVLYFVLRRRVALPLIRMSGIVTRLARQDYNVEVVDEGRRDEIGEMNQAIQIFRDNGLERERLDTERRKDQRMKDLILQMMHRVQACQNQTELADVVSRFLPQVLPGVPGDLFVLSEPGAVLASSASWLNPTSSKRLFGLDDCWGLRRGRPHVSEPGGDDVVCHHLQCEHHGGLCIPLTALGDIVGLLFLQLPKDGRLLLEAERLYLELIAENIGLAVANLQLRQRLTGMAKRDALTGQLNRRSLDDMLNQLIEAPLTAQTTCLMIDIDYFKRFNDSFGHDAGDAVMRYVARILSELVSDAGDVFRFGGEEFTVLLRELSLTDAYDLAEKLRAAIEQSPLSHRGQLLDPITISIGSASSPEDGPVTSIIERADAALLLAKRGGRNRIVCSSNLVRDDTV